MSNPNFEVSTITTAGAEMLAQATEGKKVIFSGCAATSTVYTLALAKLIYNVPRDRITNLIEVTDVTDARILVRATFEPSALTGGEANSLILFGRLSSHKEDAMTPICVVSNSAPFYLPTSDQAAVTSFDCLFTVQYNISSPVVVEQTSALECSLAEFRQLKERVVTTHKAGESTVGEGQTIYGEKTFLNGAKFKEAGADDRKASVDANELKIVKTTGAPFAASYGQNIEISSFSAEATNFKVKDEKLSFGRWGDSTPFFCIDCSGDAGSISMGISPNSDDEYSVAVIESAADSDDGVYLAADHAKIKKLSVGNVLPAGNVSYSLGSADNYWLAVFADTLKARAADFSDQITANSVVAQYVYPTEKNTNNLGSSTREWSYVYTKKAAISSTLTVSGATTLNSALTVSGATTLNSTLNALKGVSLLGSVLTFKTEGGTSYKMNYFSSGIDVYGNLAPGSNATYSLGNSNYKWSNIYASSLSGSALALADVLVPTNASNARVSIGSVFIGVLRTLRAAGTSETTWPRGTTLSVPSFDIRVLSLCTASDPGADALLIGRRAGSAITSGSYRLLSEMYVTENSTTSSVYKGGVAIMVRVA